MDEQLSIRIEALAESVRTSMTVDEAEEPLSELTELISKCAQEDGRVHELSGLVFRALLPAFVMTDSDFKTPGSLNQPTKAMHAAKQACVAWLIGLAASVPVLLVPEPTSRTAYSKRMHMDWDDENTPPSDDNEQDSEEEKVSKKPDKKECEVFLDPLVSLMQRLAVRCPDKSEWRRAIIVDVLGVIAKQLAPALVARYVEFLKKLVYSDKSAWRVWALEALAQVGNEGAISVALGRTRDAVPGVRCAALKAATTLSLSVGPITPEVLSTISDTFVRMSRDEKPSVRRAAVSVFDQIVPITGLTCELASVLALLTMDESLMVRKASVASIASISPDQTLWGSLWCNSVLPLVTDVEATVVEKVVESFEQCLLLPIVAKTASPSLLRLLESMNENWEHSEYAKRALRQVVRKGDAKFNRQVLTGIERILKSGDSACPPLWALLDEFAASGLTLSCAQMSEFFHLPGEPNIPLCRILRGMFDKKMKFEQVELIQQKLIDFLSHRPESISLLHEVVRLLFATGASKQTFQSILETSENELENVLKGKDCSVWHIAALGELAGLGFLPTARGLTALEATATNRVYLDAGVHCPLAPTVRASAMVAFGKICLEKESIAKRAVSKFAAHLSREEHPIVRNNVLIVLGDLCVLYTGLVDQYLPWVTNCLSDQNDLIRYQAAVVVASLLAEDYIKFKGQIVFRLLFLLSDSNLKIKFFVESVFSRILFLRHSASLKTLFAETVCALNGYMKHPQFQGGMGNRDFCLVAQMNRRREIYAFMLLNVATTEQKFNSIVQLANSLLAAFVDEDVTNGQVQIPMKESDPAAQVMIDTLYLLSCKELKLSRGGPNTGEEDEEKKIFDAALQKKTIVDNLVPLLIQLNRLCESKRSPISKYVRDCLRELMKDYREDVSVILHSDAQLAEELVWDLRQQDGERNGDEVVVEDSELVAEPTAALETTGVPDKTSPVDPKTDEPMEEDSSDEEKVEKRARRSVAKTDVKRVKTSKQVDVKEEDVQPVRGSRRLARKN